MGRKYKFLEQSTGNLTRIQQETKYKAEFLSKDGFKELPSTPPSYLPKYAKQEYERVAPQIKKLPVRDLDLTVFLLYCTWYAAYRETLDYIATFPESAKDPKAAGNRLAGYLTLNKITTNIKALSSELGLTVNSRMQMNLEGLNTKPKDGPKSMKERFG